MTDVWTFEDEQNWLIMLSFISRAVCDLTTTMAIAWNLKQKRDSGVKEYDLKLCIVYPYYNWT